MIMKRLRVTFVQAIVILAISVGIAGAAAWMHPRAPAWYVVTAVNSWDLTPEQVRDLDDEVVWIDARTEADFEKGHIKGALLLNEDEWGDLVFEHQDTLQAAMGKAVVVYCDGTGCERSQHVAEKLRQLIGLDPVYVLRGDWREFQK